MREAAPGSATNTAECLPRIEAQRAQLLQAHGVLRCLYEVLLHAECDDAVFYAEAAYVAANLISNTAEELDSEHIRKSG